MNIALKIMVLVALSMPLSLEAKTYTKEICAYNTLINEASAIDNGEAEKSIRTQIAALQKELGVKVETSTPTRAMSSESASVLEEVCVKASWQAAK